MSRDDVRCPTCRRTARVVPGAVGPECERCGGLLVGASPSKPTAAPASSSAAVEEEHGPIVEAVADRVLAEFSQRAGSVREIADMHEIAADYVAGAYQYDAERARESAERRQRARTWREFAASVGGR